VKLARGDIRPYKEHTKTILTLGLAAFFNQIAMMLVQIVMNNTITKYGAESVYGSDIPFAAVGVIMKFNIMIMAFLIGTAQGCQPIVGYNYGAGKYHRVKKTFFTGAIIVTGVSVIAFAAFQIFPRQIVSIFGKGDSFNDLDFEFAEKFFRIFMFMAFANGIQPLTSNFFTSIGKAPKGIILSLTRQILFLIPLLLILPSFMGLDGFLYAGPIADAVALVVAGLLIMFEMRNIKKLQIFSTMTADDQFAGKY
jgi:Na+-driven multidrug efflux pump